MEKKSVSERQSFIIKPIISPALPLDPEGKLMFQ